jgi:4a-hydroxytetrahydrobiopterin dehydratase
MSDNRCYLDLLGKKCVPCEGGAAPLTEAEALRYLEGTTGWMHEDHKIWREIVFKDFMAAVDFMNRLAKVAEEEGHHPNMALHSWNKVRVELWTHAIGGLSENDFIQAAKVNQIMDENPGLLKA